MLLFLPPLAPPYKGGGMIKAPNVYVNCSWCWDGEFTSRVYWLKHPAGNNFALLED